MFRTYQVLWNRLIQVTDAATVIVSFLVAWFVRFQTGWVAYSVHSPLSYYLPVMLLAIPVFLCANWLAGMYKPMRRRTLWQETVTVIRSLVFGLLAFMSLLYFLHIAQFSRTLLAVYAAVFGILTYGVHVAMRWLLQNARSRGMNRKYILIVGWTPSARRFVETLHEQPWFGYHIIGCVADKPDASLAESGINQVGTLPELQDVLSSHLVDHVVISLTTETSQALPDVIAVCEAHGIQSLIVPDYLDAIQSKPQFEMFAGMPLIDTRYVPLDDAFNAAIKRIFDVAFSVVVLLCLSPVYALIALVVKITSPGPVLFRQQRLGKNRRRFTMYKFRTMIAQADETSDDGWTTQNDPRRTPIGRILRRFSLDELPQFWNVLIGDMSVIGPRPERPQLVDRFKDEVPRYMIKHRVRPGITGWAQVNGWRGDTSLIERIQYDLEYIENWSMMMDVKIALRTLGEGLFHPNAY